MNDQRISGLVSACLAMLIIIAIVAITGCMDSPYNQQDPVTPTGNPQSENPVGTTKSAIPATTVSPSLKTPTSTVMPQKTTPPLPATGSSDGIIQLDSIGVISNGEWYKITGITRLPVGSDLVLQLRPDDGTTPTGFEKDAAGGASGGPASIMEGNGTWNQIVMKGKITTGQEIAGGGRWVAVVGDRKDPEWFKNGDYFDMGTHIAWAYFTMK